MNCIYNEVACVVDASPAIANGNKTSFLRENITNVLISNLLNETNLNEAHTSAIAAVVTANRLTFILDSGASSHMFPLAELLHSVKTNVKGIVSLGDSSKQLTFTGMGK